MKRIREVVMLLLLLQSSLTASVTIYEEANDKYSEEMNFSPAYITCGGEKDGGKDKTGPDAVEITEVEEMFAEHGSESAWNVYNIGDLAKSEVDYAKCALCSFHSIKCSEDPNTLEYICSRRSVFKGKPNDATCEKHIVSFKMRPGSGVDNTNMKRERRDGAEGYPKVIDIPIADGQNKNHRQSRESRCAMPLPMTTATVKCKVYPKKAKCTQLCALGYTLEGGIAQHMECNVADGIWKPTGFKECKPYVDCHLILTSGGSLGCTSMSVTKPPECRVECFHFEDKDEVPAQNYTCSVDGTWDPPLPFCVLPGSGLALVEAPAVKHHSDLEEE